MKQKIRLTESDLHRIVKESVNMILNEYTNGYTEKLYANLEQTPEDTQATRARKERARDYLAKRWKRENNLEDNQVDAVAMGDSKSLYDANLPGTFLKRYDKNVAPSRGMAFRLERQRPKPKKETPPAHPTPKKKWWQK